MTPFSGNVSFGEALTEEIQGFFEYMTQPYRAWEGYFLLPTSGIDLLNKHGLFSSETCRLDIDGDATVNIYIKRVHESSNELSIRVCFSSTGPPLS
jgi:hypothetical protein